MIFVEKLIYEVEEYAKAICVPVSYISSYTFMFVSACRYFFSHIAHRQNQEKSADVGLSMVVCSS